MIINLHDAHDRYTYLTQKSFGIGECCQDLIDQWPFQEAHYMYIFAHARTEDDGVNKRLIWQPRLTKPKSQSNSMLFKTYRGADTLEIRWMIPAKELWGQYKKGNVTASRIVSESIHDFKYNRDKLDRTEEEDYSDEKIDAIYRNLKQEALRRASKAASSVQPSIPDYLKECHASDQRAP